MSNFPFASPSAVTLRATTATPPALLGFDGFIDTICDVVDTRDNAAEYERVKTLAAYGQHVEWNRPPTFCCCANSL